MNRLLILLLMAMTVGCAKQAYVGMKKHRFHDKGDHIIWIQVAGLSEEHLAMLKFPQHNSEGGKKQLSFERSLCLGKLWNYNLYSLRPNARKGFMSQMLGSKNIKGSCDDLDREPLWYYFQQAGYSTGVFESRKRNKELDYFNGCSDRKKFTNGLTQWRRKQAPKGANKFHYQDGLKSEPAEIYYDRSCQNNTCNVPFETHTLKVWENYSSNNQKTFFIIRDFVYEDLVEKRKVLKAKERLAAIETIYDYFSKLSQRKKVTIVLTTSSEIKLDFPRMGKSWSKFEKTGRNLGHRSRSLSSSIWASGYGSENFCGQFEESNILKAFIWSPDQSFIDRFTL